MQRFPVEGDYNLTGYTRGFRPIGSDPIRVGFWIDGKMVHDGAVPVSDNGEMNGLHHDFRCDSGYRCAYTNRGWRVTACERSIGCFFFNHQKSADHEVARLPADWHHYGSRPGKSVAVTQVAGGLDYGSAGLPRILVNR